VGLRRGEGEQVYQQDFFGGGIELVGGIPSFFKGEIAKRGRL